MSIRYTLALAPALLLAGCASTAPVMDPAPAVTVAPAAAAAPVPVAPSASAASSEAAASAAAPIAATIDPLRPDVRIDLDDRSARIDLWQRVRNGFAMPDLVGPLVRDREQWYATRPDYVQRMTERGGRYLFHIVEEVEKRGLPTELALLPFIESAFNPQAMSSARASGMWQFMPATGRDFELKQNVFRDDRRDVLESTRAALDYLTRLHGMFGDWHLALAAYNWGEGSVQRAIARNRRTGRPTDYASLGMPDETRYYVPKLQAVKNIVAQPQAFSLVLPELSNHPYFLSVPIERDIDVTVAARLSGMALADFQALNPQMNKPVILAAGTPRVLLPYDHANAFVKALPAHDGPLASWTAWVAPRHMKTADAARQVGMSEADLREVNKIPPNMVVQSGSTLLVPRAPHKAADVSEHTAENGTIALVRDGPPLRRVAYKAGKKGDSVAAVAKRYRVTAAQVAQWNDVGTTARFAAGASIVVFLPAHAAKTGKRAAASATKRGVKAAAVRKSRPATAPRAPTKR